MDTFTVVTELPAKPDKDLLIAPDGALLVHAVVQIEVVDVAKDTGTLRCTFTLVDDRRRRCTADSDVNYRAAGPDRVTCSDTDDAPVRPGQPYAVAVAFTIPADAGGSVRLRMALPTDEQLIEFARVS